MVAPGNCLIEFCKWETRGSNNFSNTQLETAGAGRGNLFLQFLRDDLLRQDADVDLVTRISRPLRRTSATCPSKRSRALWTKWRSCR